MGELLGSVQAGNLVISSISISPPKHTIIHDVCINIERIVTGTKVRHAFKGKHDLKEVLLFSKYNVLKLMPIMFLCCVQINRSVQKRLVAMATERFFKPTSL